MVMLCTQEEELPQSSVATQRREITFVPPQELLTLSLKPIVTRPQPSVAVAIPVALVRISAGHSRARFCGQWMTGAVVSTTVIVWTPFVLFPQASVAVQVRLITLVPPQLLFTASRKLIDTAPHPSCAVAIPVAFVRVSAGHSNVRSGG